MRSLIYLVTGVMAAALAPLANATLTLSESVNGGSFGNVCTGNPACSPGLSFTDSANVNFFILGASSNAPGTPANADVTQASVRVTNNSAGTQSFVMRVSDIGFTAPAGATTLFNNISGTVITGSPVNLFSSFACADGNNLLNSCVGASGFQTSTIVSAITGSNTSGANSNSLAIALLPAPFSMTEQIMVTLGAGSVITFSVSADVVPAAEPATIGILGMGVLGLAAATRRRKPVDEMLGVA